MTDTLIQDTLTMAHQIISQSKEVNHSTNWWMWLAFVEFGVLTFLFVRNKLKHIPVTTKQKFKEDALKQEIDFNNIINSSFNSTQLYDELKIKCHPDKFPNDKEKIAIAEKLFKEITKNKNNVNKLKELKKEAKKKLNVNF